MTALAMRPLGRTGLAVSALGLGGAPLGNLFSPVGSDEAELTLRRAWEHGLRLLDTAPFYGRGLSERRIGAFLRNKPRSSFVLSTKVGRRLFATENPIDGGDYKDVLPFEVAYDYSADGALRSLEESLTRLGLDHVDIVYIHDIGIDAHGAEQARRYREALEGAYPALAGLRAQGVVRAIGLGVNDWRVCTNFLRDADPDCFLLAGRYTLLEQEPLAGGLLDACLRRCVALVVGGPYNSGILATGPVPGAMYEYKPAPPPILARVAALEGVAREHSVPLAAAALQFPLAHPAVAAVIAGARTADEVACNVALFSAAIPADFWADLKRRGLLAAEAPSP
jgi:D-threo-aldose 1-dehydrogenase